MTVVRYARSEPPIGLLILAFASICACARAGAAQAPAEAPPDLAKRVARRQTETRQARDQYTYRQTVTFEEMSPRGAREGEYREIREVIFSPSGERTERLVGNPVHNLKRLQLTDEDFRDIREIQPFLFDSEQFWAYETRFKGEENMDNVDCWLLQVRPRQILAGQRLFDGLLWVSKQDYSVVRSEGKAVPEYRSMKGENLFPRFTTLWKPVEGGFWFPYETLADDTLDFRTGPLRVRMTIRYADYKRFGAETSITFGEEEKKK